AHNELLNQQALGQKIKIHTKRSGLPELEDADIAILGVVETRNDIDYAGAELHFNNIRQVFYSLYPGNWKKKIVDLGDINQGETVEDTYFAVKTIITILLEKGIIPVLLGGSQDITYANYRAYDDFLPMVNMVNVDVKFDLGDSSKPIKNDSFVGKVILDQPYNLFNYATLGYQTYFNSQEEIDLMEKLYFEAYRLGEITGNLTLAEPVMRDANIVTLDLKSIKASDVGNNQKFSPNGISGKDICAIARYAGISDKVTSFGIYEYKPSKQDETTAMLISQIIWYFIEGVNLRVKDDDFLLTNNYQKFITLADSQELVFYKSNKTDRWWIEIPFLKDVNNRSEEHTSELQS